MDLPTVSAQCFVSKLAYSCLIDSIAELIMFHLGATAYMQSAVRPAQVACYDCNKVVSIKQMRAHVGQHILSRQVRAKDTESEDWV
jgi:hypothetical protein